MFGANREWALARLDRAGLLWLLTGRRVVARSSDAAVLVTGSGARQTYRRRPPVPGELALAWEMVKKVSD